MWVWGSKGGFGTGKQEDWGWGKIDKREDSRDVEDRREKEERGESEGEDRKKEGATSKVGEEAVGLKRVK